jgi:hypothetical protein
VIRDGLLNYRIVNLLFEGIITVLWHYPHQPQQKPIDAKRATLIVT